MEKKKWVSPTMSIAVIGAQDVITASPTSVNDINWKDYFDADI